MIKSSALLLKSFLSVRWGTVIFSCEWSGREDPVDCNFKLKQHSHYRCADIHLTLDFIFG